MTASSNAQVSAGKCKHCLTDEEIDFFLVCEINARYYYEEAEQLRKDNARKDSMITICESANNELKANEVDLKKKASNSDRSRDNYKADLGICNEKYYKQKERSNRRAGIAIGSISVNILLGALLYFAAK